jgi:hypothetical protein
MIAIWFIEASNFRMVIIILNLLKQSCLLTLCRKHNKSKQWVNSVYTANMLVIKSLFGSYNYFPFNYISFRAFGTRYFLLIDESFFFIN